MTVEKDWLKEAQDGLKRKIHYCSCSKKDTALDKVPAQVKHMSQALLNIVEYIKITRELNEEKEY
jgi:hypothetical protein